MNKGLIVFAREPLPGKVKTRLGREVGDRAAAEIYGAMLADVLERATSLLPEVRPLVFWSLESGEIPSCPAFRHLEAFEQRGATLGQRMADAFERAFESGSEVCCIIGSDSPDLPAGYVLRAFELLEQGEADAVFGPAEDGGYYLLGLRQTCHGIFEDIPWGTPLVLETNLERARGLGLRTALLPAWYDIDTLDDLLRLTRSAPANARRTREAAGRLLKDHANFTPSEEISP